MKMEEKMLLMICCCQKWRLPYWSLKFFSASSASTSTTQEIWRRWRIEVQGVLKGNQWIFHVRDHGIDSIRYPGTWNKLCPNNSSLSTMGHCFFTAIHNEATEQFRLRIHKMATFVLFMGTFLFQRPVVPQSISIGTWICHGAAFSTHAAWYSTCSLHITLPESSPIIFCFIKLFCTLLERLLFFELP